MPQTDAYISLKEIVASWRFDRGKSIHYHLKAVALAAAAVRELSLTSLPLLNHTLLTRQPGEAFFRLPDGYTEYVRLGIRVGDGFIPINVADRLMPYANAGASDLGNDLGTGFGSATSSWTGSTTTPPSFNPGSFGPGLNTNGSSAGLPYVGPVSPNGFNALSPWFGIGWYGWSAPLFGKSGERYFGVTIDVAQGLILCPDGWPYNELYLAYTGVGSIDSMTSIPVVAQATIEAYMDWKYALNKRNGKSEANVLKPLLDEQHRLLRARLNKISVEEIAEILAPYRSWGRTTNEYYNGSTAPAAPSTFVFGRSNQFNITITSNTILNAFPAGSYPTLVILNGQYIQPNNFTYTGTTLDLSAIGGLNVGDVVTIFYQ